MARKSHTQKIGNLQPNTIFTNDNLLVMRGIETETIDLIATDPPFNSKRIFKAPIGSASEGAEFGDIWTFDDIDESWVRNMESQYPQVWNFVQTILATGDKSLASYIIFMHARIVEMHRILKPTGSLYLHCDQTAAHYLKILLDCVFGKKNFKNNIVWNYDYGGRSKQMFPRKHDDILFYTKSDKWVFNTTDMDKLPYKGGVHLYRGDTEAKKDGKLPTDVWDIPVINTMSKERTGYPTQKPLSLYERIIKASSNEDDMVLDPFCGCATTCVAAHKLQRYWIGIDVSEKANVLVRERLQDEVGLETVDVNHRTDLPVRKNDITITPKPELRKRLYGEQAGYCLHCHQHFQIEAMDLDHIVPDSRGGHDGDDNKQLLCRPCNIRKGNKDDATAKAFMEDRMKSLGLLR